MKKRFLAASFVLAMFVGIGISLIPEKSFAIPNATIIKGHAVYFSDANGTHVYIECDGHGPITCHVYPANHSGNNN